MYKNSSPAYRWGICAIPLAVLTACGGGSDGDDGSARGALNDAPSTVMTLSAAQIDTAGGLTALVGSAKCDVKVVALDYVTVGANGERLNAAGKVINASAVMLVPTGAAAECNAPAALVGYARGTNIQKERTLAADPVDKETLALAAVFAAQGYAVVATDYLGYAKSNYPYHPYLHAESEASAVLDSVRAARNAASKVGASLSGKVMLSGFSQGGHSSMAAHRAAERDNAPEITVAAGAHLGGPYNLSGYLREKNAGSGYQVVVPYMLTGFQKTYGNVYSDAKEVFQAKYAGTIENLMPAVGLTLTNVLTSGKLPGLSPTGLLSDNEARDQLFLPAFISDLQSNDKNGSYLAARKNDLLGWNPKAPLLLCGGAKDTTVNPNIHQKVMKADFDSRGLSNVTSVDVDPLIQTVFGPEPTDPASPAYAKYFGSYHGAYEGVLCEVQAKKFFDGVLKK